MKLPLYNMGEFFYAMRMKIGMFFFKGQQFVTSLIPVIFVLLFNVAQENTWIKGETLKLLTVSFKNNHGLN